MSGGPFQLLLDAEGDGHFLGVKLQAGELIVLLADDVLQAFVTACAGFRPRA